MSATLDEYEFGRVLGAVLVGGAVADQCDPVFVESLGREMRPVFVALVRNVSDVIAAFARVATEETTT